MWCWWSFKDLEVELDHLKDLDPIAVKDGLSVYSFNHLGDEVITATSVLTVEEIRSSVLAEDNNVDDDEWQPDDIDFDVEGPRRPSWDKLEGALDVIQNTSLSSSQHV